MAKTTLRLSFPQWQGGNNPPYYLGSLLLSFLAPQTEGPTEEVPVVAPGSGSLSDENGMTGRSALVRQLKAAETLIARHDPDALVVLGGDCLVSLVPFAHLLEKYGDSLGVLWIDSHPDVQTTEQYANAHAHVLGALIGTGDPDLVNHVPRKLSPAKIMIAGLHDPLPYEHDYLARHRIATASPEQVKSGGQAVMEWMAREKITHLAIHLDLDVLDPALFRSVLFARPGRGEHDFGDVAEGRLTFDDVLGLINQATSVAEPVGLTVAEHLPWDMVNLQNLLHELPLLKQS